jgi:hypothetical protein
MTTIQEYAEHLVTTYVLQRAGEDLTGRELGDPFELSGDTERDAVIVLDQLQMTYMGGVRALSAVVMAAGRHGLDRDELLREALTLLAERD